MSKEPEAEKMTNLDLTSIRLVESPVLCAEETQTFYVSLDTLNFLGLDKAANKKKKVIFTGAVQLLQQTKLEPTEENVNQLADVYAQCLNLLVKQGIEWVQFDEVQLADDLNTQWQFAFQTIYHTLKSCGINIVIATPALKQNLQLACELPVQGIHLQTNDNKDELERLVDWLSVSKVLLLDKPKDIEEVPVNLNTFQDRVVWV